MKSGKSLWIVAFALGLVVAGLMHVALRYQVMQAGYAIAEELHEKHVLEEENRKLRLEQSLLRDPARIERIAREKLSMVRPEPTQIRVVHPVRHELVIR
jgi:cell division protein FtsL